MGPTRGASREHSHAAWSLHWDSLQLEANNVMLLHFEYSLDINNHKVDPIMWMWLDCHKESRCGLVEKYGLVTE